jgi:hypothetical protein
MKANDRTYKNKKWEDCKKELLKNMSKKDIEAAKKMRKKNESK